MEPESQQREPSGTAGARGAQGQVPRASPVQPDPVELLRGRAPELSEQAACAVMVLEAPEWDRTMAERAARAAHEAAQRQGIKIDTAVLRGTVVAAVSAGVGRAARPAGLRALGAEAQAQAADSVGSPPPWVGAGGAFSGLAGVRASYGEAQEALRIGRLLWAEPAVVLFEDVLVLAAVSADPALRARVSGILDPLSSYSRRSRGELLETLQAFFDADLELHGAAKRLGVHRHTVCYRLGLAERLLGRSVRTGADRLLVELAVRVRRLEAERSRPLA